MFPFIPEEFFALVEQAVVVAYANPAAQVPELLLVVIPRRVGLDIGLDVQLLIELLEEHTHVDDEQTLRQGIREVDVDEVREGNQ